VDFFPCHDLVRDLLDPRAVLSDEVVCGHVRLADELRCESPLGWLPEHPPCDVVVLDAARTVHELEPDLLEPPQDALLLLGVAAFAEVERLRPHSRGADHERGEAGYRLDVTTDPARRLPVEDALGGHCADPPDQRRDLVGAPLADMSPLLARLEG